MSTDPPHVILVEDNVDDADLARIALDRTKVPHHLTVFSDGEAVVDHLYGTGIHHAPPALILLDLKLPKMDGKTILREIRGNPLTARVPVVALTSSRLEQDLVDAYCLGVNSYFVKPLDFDEFMRKTMVLMTYWLGLNLSPPAFEPTPGGFERSIAVVNEAILPPPRARYPFDIVFVDTNEQDLERTRAGFEACAPVRMRTLRSFEEIIHFLRGAGGPPPLLAPTFPRLFVVDVELDTGDGRDVLQALRYRSDHHAVVVMFTRRAAPAFISECYRVKVSGVVRKPDAADDYAKAARLLAYYWMYVNETPPDPAWSRQAIGHPG